MQAPVPLDGNGALLPIHFWAALKLVNAMKILQVGDHGKGYCLDCRDLVTITFMLRDVPFRDGIGTAKGILVGVCDRCDTAIALPAQCTSAIAAARNVALAEAGLAEANVLQSAG
jgi:hypothetical protein